MKQFFWGAVVALSLFSCEKDYVAPNSINLNSGKLEYKLNNIPLVANNQQIDKLLINPEDEDDTKINKYLYKLGLAIRPLVKEADFNRVIIELAKNSETETANLLKLADVAPEYYDRINKELAKDNLSLELIANDFTHRPIAPDPRKPKEAEIEKYIPSIFVPNLQNINIDLQPIISPNVVVDSRNNEAIEDNIIAWYYEENGMLQEILLSEETSLKTSNPLFLLDNAVSTLKVEQDLNAQVEPLDVSQGAVSKKEFSMARSNKYSFSSYEHSIKSHSYRYESWVSAKSEFSVVAFRIGPDGAVQSIYSSGSPAQNYSEINKISSSEIGTLLYKWHHHADNWQPWSNPNTPHAIQSNVNMVYWNTYERDWNNSAKPLGGGTANGVSISMQGRMKYSNEWYTWHPSTVKIHYTKFYWIFAYGPQWQDSYKARFRLWKV